MGDDKLNKTLDSINENLKKVNDTLEKHGNIFEKHEKLLDTLLIGQINHGEHIGNLETRVDSVEIKINHVIEKEDYMIKLLETMTAEQAANKHRSDRQETRIEILEKDVKQLQVAVLQ